jgi:uncharacterized membrane protein
VSLFLCGSNSAVINRFILWLSLAGMVLALHLWIQKARDFDQGCLGLETHSVPAEGGCEAVSELPASHLFGVSNAAWGYAFYFTLALISFAKIVAPSPWPVRLHRAGEIGVVLALLYSGYLVYQMGFVAHAWCVLCTISAALVTILFGLHVAMRRRGGFRPIAENARGTELGLAVSGLFAASGVLVGVLLFVNRLGTRPLDQGYEGRELERIIGETLPVYIDRPKLIEMRACHFDRSAPELNLEQIIGPDTPFLGHPNGTPVIVFYDPNCEHCKEYHAGFSRIAERLKDRGRFYVLPRMIWNRSLLAVEALTVAEHSEKYFDLWQRLFDRQTRNGWTTAQIAEIFRELKIDTTDLAKRLEAAEAAAIARRKQLAAAGISGVPAVYIGKNRVWALNQTEQCVVRLFDRVAPVSGASPRTP